MDNELTQRIQRWLQLEQPTVGDINEAAAMLLSIDRNKILYRNIIRRPEKLLPKLRHELQKHLRYRLDGLTLDGVRKLDREVRSLSLTLSQGEGTADGQDKLPLPSPQGDGASRRGRRADHDSLPPEIQRLWTLNAERWKRMKEAFATCQLLEQPCDRYEHLKLISDTYKLYKQDMARYDSFSE